jgi:hypothetical protein
VTTNIGTRGQVVIPKAGDDFEVLTDEDDFDLILLRCIRPAANTGLVKHLRASPYKGEIRIPPRRSEPMRKLTV